MSTTILGLYFDTFLRANYFQSSKNKIANARERVVVEFESTKGELIEGLSYTENNEDLIASVELINNYQDKNNYNSALLDEEKKEIARYLLAKIKASFNQSAVLYDMHGDLVAYAYKESRSYSLNFISYKNGVEILYSKDEDAELYQPREIKEARVSLRHVAYYTQPDLKKSVIVTYHTTDNNIYIVSHNSVFDPQNSDRTIFHIEMNKLYNDEYFSKLSKAIGVNVFISHDIRDRNGAVELFDRGRLRDQDILEDEKNYFSSFTFLTKEGSASLMFSLDKDALYDSLHTNRKQLLIFMILSMIVILVVFNTLILLGISKPLKRLMLQISRIQEGDYSESARLNTGDELQDISEHINMLAVSLESRETSLKSSQNQLEYLSTHDGLTGLFNRRSFSMKLDYALQKAKRNQSKVAILFLDLDEFKQVNDTLGHTIGDKLLQAVSHRLEDSLRESDVLARVGGDEFNIFVDGFKNITELQVFAQRLLDDFEEPFVDSENEIVSSTSIGIALYPDDGEDAETLIKNADLAMYKSKERGKNSYSFYSIKFSESLQHRMDIVQALKGAIKNQNEFVLHYQPKVSIATQKVVGVEALIRWKSPELGFVRPDEFISIAEETHMILDIGRWVLREACKDFVLLKRRGYNVNQMSVNVSGVQLEYGDMFQTLKETLAYTGMKAENLELEVTESYIATNEKSAIETLTKFRNMGLSLAIDDFGTGYSSMSYLQALPITRLKIDKAFVDDLPESTQSVAVVNAIISLAQAFNLKITVEGVELEKQLEFFQGKYCHDIQGYYYSKPLPFKELQEYLKNNL